MENEILLVADSVSGEKDLPKESIFEAIEQALATATKKRYKEITNIKVTIGEELIFQNLVINILKCQNSKFDDDPEVTAYMQIKDLKSKDKDKVFVFNGWTFASSPSIKPFDHPVYDIWLKKCYS